MITEELLEELVESTKKGLELGKTLLKRDEYLLNFRTDQESWSIYECLEHLNLYGDHYLEKIEEALRVHKKEASPMFFKGGILGNYFARLIRPEHGKIRKMKTMASMDPMYKNFNRNTVCRFVNQQQKLLMLLQKCSDFNIQKIKIQTTLSKFLYLNLGDTLRFVVYHNERHILQIKELLCKEDSLVNGNA